MKQTQGTFPVKLILYDETSIDVEEKSDEIIFIIIFKSMVKLNKQDEMGWPQKLCLIRKTVTIQICQEHFHS